MKTTILLALTIFLTLLGCVQNQQGELIYVCESGDKVSNPSLCPKSQQIMQSNNTLQQETPNLQNKEICPYECCDSERYDYKGCQAGKTCINNTCVATDCPYECCDGTTNQLKNCPSNMECIANQCIKKICPFECCDESIYQLKNCTTGYTCTNNICVQIPEAKLSATIDGCQHGIDIFHGQGEVSNVYVTIENFGTKEAQNLKVLLTASDQSNQSNTPQIQVSAFPSVSKLKTKIKLDTQTGEGNQTIITMSVTSNDTQTITQTYASCEYDIPSQINQIESYVPLETLTNIAQAIVPLW